MILIFIGSCVILLVLTSTCAREPRELGEWPLFTGPFPVPSLLLIKGTEGTNSLFKRVRRLTTHHPH